MNDLEKAIEEIEKQLKDGENFNLKYSQTLKDLNTLRLECASLNNKNTKLKQDIHILLKRLYLNYDERELLLVSN